jgi:hypothetical protein
MPKSSSHATVRPLRPADLVLLASLWAMGRPPFGAVYRNEAQTWGRLGLEERGLRLLEGTAKQWVPFAGRGHAWIAARGLTACALASVRPRGNPSAWEVDHLVAGQGEEGLCLTLLERLGQSLGQVGAEKVFLRLRADSPLLKLVRQAGFFPYLKEHLLALHGAPQGLEPAKLSLRERTAADTLPLFQLYNAAVPVAVRRNEGATLREWVALQEKGHCQHLLAPGTEGPAAQLRISKRAGGGRFSLVVQRRQEVPLDHLLAAALDYLAGKRPIFCLVPEYQKAVGRRLEELGFRAEAEYRVLVNRLVVPVEETVPVAEAVRQPYPVS